MCPPKAETLFLFIANLELLVLHYAKHKYPRLRRECVCLPTRTQLNKKLKQLKVKKTAKQRMPFSMGPISDNIYRNI